MSTSTQNAPKGNAPKKANPIFMPIAITVLFVICVPYLYYAVKINLYGVANAPKDYNFPNFTEFWKVIAGACATQALRFVVHSVMPGIFAPIVKGDDEQTKAKYIKKACEHTFRTIYFACSAYWGWSLLKDSSYLYQSLGGPEGGDLLTMKLETIFFVYDSRLLDYSLYTFGFHFGNFIQHQFFDEHGTDYNEMLIHHLATNCLYFCYIFSGTVPFGSIVAYLHDLADIPANTGKVLSSTTYEKSSIVVGLVLMILWCHTRCILLPKIIYYLATKAMYTVPGEEQFQPYIYLSVIFLSVMCALHYFWFAMFFKILGRFLTTGTATDLGNKVEKTKDE